MNSSRQKTCTRLLLAVAALLCCAAPGCNSDSNSELLERELRCQERRIYQLEDELDDMGYALEASRRENQALKTEMAGGDKGAGSTPSSAAPQIEAPSIEPPKLEFIPKSKP